MTDYFLKEMFENRVYQELRAVVEPWQEIAYNNDVLTVVWLVLHAESILQGLGSL